MLLTDINSKIPAQTLKTHEKIILSGTNKNYLEISFFNSKEPFFLNNDFFHKKSHIISFKYLDFKRKAGNASYVLSNNKLQHIT